ncbi:GntR family transcriptional regulator [Nocardia sp. NBC_00881]|uniref:GntR family transcriptional regulator n=1 Tax=Nocardia sp. NBC_00881 TaxID=2975995 RepID=UPI0038645F9D|nr:GntR family transcriptional regulator [Nocardia sp. NBC_00881]
MATPEGPLVLDGRPTAQLIADHLREQIIQGDFRPGQQINESVLAGQLRTSRGPVREALQRLAQEGILVSLRNRGVFVPELSIDDIKEIYAVREAVESASANILLAAGQEQINRTCQSLKETLTEMATQVALSDWQALTRLDMKFHTSFVERTGNSRLIRIYDTLVAESRMCILNLRVSYPRVDVLVQEHQNLLDLLEAGDNEGLQQAISRHMRKAVDDLTTTTHQN